MKINLENKNMKYIASLSYGKDSLYMLEIIYQNKLPLDEIITCDVWATNTIPADLPPMVDFKKKADKLILDRYGIKVKHIRSKYTYEEYFYKVKQKGNKVGQIYGFPFTLGNWCTSCLKTSVLNSYIGKNSTYIGYAVEETIYGYYLNLLKNSNVGNEYEKYRERLFKKFVGDI